jgi:hypothetical protein
VRSVRKADNLTTILCAVVKKSGNLNFLEHSGPLQACNGTSLPSTFTRDQILVVLSRSPDCIASSASRIPDCIVSSASRSPDCIVSSASQQLYSLCYQCRRSICQHGPTQQRMHHLTGHTWHRNAWSCLTHGTLTYLKQNGYCTEHCSNPVLRTVPHSIF